MPRCPKGTKKDKYSGECYAIIRKKTQSRRKKSLRCPKGTKKDKTSGECYKYN